MRVLIFISLAEPYARIVADEGIVARVPAQAAVLDAVDAPGGIEMAQGVERVLRCR